jgi:hypothetical protein
MKKFLLTLAVAVSALTANAQDEGGFYGNKFFDNCFIGVNGGVGAGTTHNAIFKNTNWNAGLRLGKFFSPIFGFGIEGNLYFNNRHGSYVNPQGGNNLSGGNTVHYSNVGFFGMINLMNAVGNYLGEPRKFEIFFVPGFSWGHNFGNNPTPEGTKMNTLNNKLAFDFAYNFGKFQEWQLYLEPSINYCIAGVDHENDDHSNKIVKYNINNSFLQLNLGLVYKFKTSNGAHNFMLVEACDPMELDALNNAVNDLRAKDSANVKTIANLEKETASNTGIGFQIAINYGSRDEIVRAVRKAAQKVKDSGLNPEDITEAMISDELDTAGIPDPDLLIRTGGEQRISNFLLWQTAYSELYFCDAAWPDFNKAELEKAVDAFNNRERRYGGLIS